MALSEKAREILNRPDLIEKRDRWFERMDKVFRGEYTGWNSQYVLGLSGATAGIAYDPAVPAQQRIEAALEAAAQNVSVLENEVFFRPVTVEYPPYGVHYIDKLLGAEVNFYSGQWYNKYLTTPIGSLKAPVLDEDPLWQDSKRIAEAFVEADVALPLFGLPTIASALNIAVNLYGENILVAMIEEPEAAQQDLNTINGVLCQIHDWYRRNVPQQLLQPVISWERTQPPGHGQICGCSTHLLSPALYGGMVAPLDNALLEVYPRGGMIHLCGAHRQHIPVFRDMPALKAIQLNDDAARDMQYYFEGLREDQVIYLNLCEGMTVEDAMRITGGKRLILAGTELQEPVLQR